MSCGPALPTHLADLKEHKPLFGPVVFSHPPQVLNGEERRKKPGQRGNRWPFYTKGLLFGEVAPIFPSADPGMGTEPTAEGRGYTQCPDICPRGPHEGASGPVYG